MKIQELRIGNWVQEPLGDFMQVEIIGHRENSDYVFARGKTGFGQNSFEPIPLTPDILEKAGFKWQSGKLAGYYSPVVKEMKGYQMRIWEDYDGYFIFSINDYLAKRIFDLHTLQNLFSALTGKELEINL